MFEELFAKRLSELRVAKGVSARDMSLSIGQSEGYINGLENRHGLPSMGSFFNICEYLKVTPVEFFDDGKKYPVELREAIGYLQKLDREELAHITSIMKRMI